MIELENREVFGWEHAIRGMRNPMNSWEKSDSGWNHDDPDPREHIYVDTDYEGYNNLAIGPNDQDLMMRLAKGGPVHAKYRRMITVYVDITAPLYWWKEFDTYKVGTVANSCSTMHKIHEKEFTDDDFSIEHLSIESLMEIWDSDGIIDYVSPASIMSSVIQMLNLCREKYLETNDKTWWWQMIQLLPSSYNQKRTVMLNYEVLHNMYISRKNHKLDEWREFCKWIEEALPYSELITGKEAK